MPGRAAAAVPGALDPIARLIDILPDAVLVIDTTGRIALANAALADVLGFEAAQLQGQPLASLIPAELRARHAALAARYTATGQQHLMKSRPLLQALHRSGALVPVSISLNNLDLQGARYSVAVIRDARRMRDELDAAIAQAETDPLTGIGNRLRLSRRIAEQIAMPRPFALLYFDLTGFKPFNDLYGHPVGDEVLRLVAKRTVAMVRERDLAVRVGGDEFVMLLDGVTEADLLQSRAQAVAQSLCQPFHVKEITGTIGVSIGGALFPRDAGSESDLLSIADASMYRSKKERKVYCAGAAPSANRVSA